MHEESSTRCKVDDDVHEGVVPAYLMDRETTTRAKILSSTIKQKRKEKAGKWEVPLPKPNKKMKISVIRRKRSSAEEEEEEEKVDHANSDYFNKLSADVITSIFLRCPLKSLSMLRCTSKLWNDFIISPWFLHSHLSVSTENAPQLLFMVKDYMPRLKRFRLRFVSIDMDGSKEELYTAPAHDSQLSCCQWHVCFGLVCLKTDCRIYLCNPAMQQLCELPKYSPSATPGYYHFGFGYLHSRKEYKVVHFFYRGPPCLPGELQLAQLKFEVITISNAGGISFNRWKEIADTPPCHPCLSGLLVNEFMYWLTRSRRFGRAHPTRIVSFDFKNEKFQTVSAPSSFEVRSRPMMMDLKGMLCLSDGDHFGKSSILDLWILKDKISCTWVKEYSIDLVSFGSEIITNIFRTWNEEIIFRHSGAIVFYDLKRKCFRRVKTLGLNRYGIYSKSLFSLGSI